MFTGFSTTGNAATLYLPSLSTHTFDIPLRETLWVFFFMSWVWSTLCCTLKRCMCTQHDCHRYLAPNTVAVTPIERPFEISEVVEIVVHILKNPLYTFYIYFFHRTLVGVLSTHTVGPLPTHTEGRPGEGGAKGGAPRPPPTLLVASKHRSAALPTQRWGAFRTQTAQTTHTTHITKMVHFVVPWAAEKKKNSQRYRLVPTNLQNSNSRRFK